MADCAVCGAFVSVGNPLREVVIGTSNARLKPNFSACSRSAAAPSSIPTLPNAALHERFKASSSVARPLALHDRPSKLGRSLSVCGRSSLGPLYTLVSRRNLPLSRAAAAVTSLNVEPGG
jgi:hypothetical protein